MFVLEPALRVHSTVSQLFRVLCSFYLAQMAVSLWRTGGRDVHDSHPITARRVFLTTLMNPKNLVFAFRNLSPCHQRVSMTCFPIWPVFRFCTAVACGWIAAGATLHTTGASKLHLSWFYRGEAFLLAGFAIVIFLSVYY